MSAFYKQLKQNNLNSIVSRGVIVGSEQREDLDTTQLTLRLTKLIRATGNVAESRDKPDLADDYYRYDVDNTLEHTTHRSHGKRRRKGRSLHAHVHVSSVCGAAGGAGEFLVMARRRLGRYSLVCAPRLHDWAQLVERRNADGTAHCLLHH